LLRKERYRDIAERFGVSTGALSRHSQHHLDHDSPIIPSEIGIVELAFRISQLEDRMDSLVEVVRMLAAMVEQSRTR